MDEADLAAVGSELLCPRCQAAAAGKPARHPKAEPVPAAPAPTQPPAVPAKSAASLQSLPRRVWADAMNWCRGRYWWARLPLVVFFAYMLVRHLQDPEYSGLFDGINLGIHELGHYVFMAFGRFMHAAGGTILQCLAPLISIIVFWRQRDYFAMLLCLGWLSTNLFGVATYMADARAREHFLVAPGVGVIAPGDDNAGHDWTYMFRTTGLMLHDRQIAFWTRALATALMALFLLPGSYLVWRMWRTRGERPNDQPAGEG
jgi:hypothetical protein